MRSSSPRIAKAKGILVDPITPSPREFVTGRESENRESSGGRAPRKKRGHVRFEEEPSDRIGTPLERGRTRRDHAGEPLLLTPERLADLAKKARNPNFPQDTEEAEYGKLLAGDERESYLNDFTRRPAMMAERQSSDLHEGYLYHLDEARDAASGNVRPEFRPIHEAYVRKLQRVGVKLKLGEDFASNVEIVAKHMRQSAVLMKECGRAMRRLWKSRMPAYRRRLAELGAKADESQRPPRPTLSAADEKMYPYAREIRDELAARSATITGE